MVVLWPTTPFYVTHSREMEISFVGERCLIGALSLGLFGDSIWIPFIYVNILRSFHCISFLYNSSSGP